MPERFNSTSAPMLEQIGTPLAYARPPRWAPVPDAQALLTEAERRYMTDPEFHARVDVALNAIIAATGVNLDDADRSLVRLAACVVQVVPGP